MVQVPVNVVQENGHFVAEWVGAPTYRAAGPTREIALKALRDQLSEKLVGGDLILMQVDSGGVVAEKPMHPYFGLFKDDPTVEDFIQDVYRQRDEQRIAEHGA